MTPEKTKTIEEGAEHTTPENPIDVLEDYCLGMTQMGNEAMTSNAVTGDGTVGMNMETEYHFEDGGAEDVERGTTEALGSNMDVGPTAEDFTFATTPQVGVIGELPGNVEVQPQLRVRINLTRVLLPT
ncbi:uncharacterized protein LOC130994959 isoform X2 [Salvia miltiorrhiza]|uniref:uncharacterized protein LOC130994959 isoform X2 n=1 Tax=Salvia miltiorrhiza TaxID=226208 RepID=UPI0025AB94F1|nr:uncharacterized protein LOC130994959 isoform X2 [Salvia miltiorrhiza]